MSMQDGRTPAKFAAVVDEPLPQKETICLPHACETKYVALLGLRSLGSAWGSRVLMIPVVVLAVCLFVLLGALFDSTRQKDIIPPAQSPASGRHSVPSEPSSSSPKSPERRPRLDSQTRRLSYVTADEHTELVQANVSRTAESGLFILTFVFLGVGLEFPYLCLISAVDFIKQHYGSGMVYKLAFAFDPAAVLITIVLLWRVLPWSVECAFVLAACALMGVCISPSLGSIGATSAFLCATFIGVATGGNYMEIFGAAAKISAGCVELLTSGITVSGFIVSATLVVTKCVELPGSFGCYLYFTLGSTWCIICALLQLYVVKPRLAETAQIKAQQSQLSANSVETSHFSLLWTMRWQISLTVLTLAASFCLIPGLISMCRSTYPSMEQDDWFAVILIVEFHLFNMLGSLMPGGKFPLMAAKLCNVIVMPVRFAVVAACAVYATAELRGSLDLLPHASVTLMGFSNGYLVMMAGGAAVDEVDETDKGSAGELVSVAIGLGIAAGTASAFLLKSVGVYPSSDIAMA